jgi:hypothetical protein
MNKAAFVRAAVFAVGILNIVTGATMLLAPEWFFANIGTYPPYNRHYLGDLGVVTLPLGLALVWAARHPAQNRLLIGFAALAALAHALNHAYDDFVVAAPDTVRQTLPLLVVAVVMLVAWWWTPRRT